MVLRRQIPAGEPEQTEVEKKKREEFIRGAGMVASDTVQKPKTTWTKICLRIKVEALEKIDAEIAQKLSGNRTSWISEAIEEKLKQQG
jgi:hypothetical protein